MRKILITICCLSFLSSNAVFGQKYLVSPAEYVNYFIDSATLTCKWVNNSALSSLNFPVGAKFWPKDGQASGCFHHFVYVDTSGKCYTQGDNTGGQCGQGSLSVTNYTDPTLITIDNLGNPFTNVAYVVAWAGAGGIGCYAIKRDGTAWCWGAMNGGMAVNGVSANDTLLAPTQITLPAGKSAQKIIAAEAVILLCTDGSVYGAGGANRIQLPGANNSDYTHWHQVSLPATARDIQGGGYWSYALLTTGSNYGWGYRSSFLGIGNTGYLAGNFAISIPALLDTALTNLDGSIIEMAVNIVGTYVVTSKGTLWYWGDNACGGSGQGTEIDWSTYYNPYDWDGTVATLLQQKPIQIAPGKTDFIHVFCGGPGSAGDGCLYYTAEDSKGNLYAGGRNKANVQANGILGCGGINSNRPNSWDVTRITQITPYDSLTTYSSSSFYCIANPTSTNCPGYVPSSANPPTCNAGSNQTLPIGLVTLTASDADNIHVSYRLWAQTSGPATPLLGVVTGKSLSFNAAVQGTYVFNYAVQDNEYNNANSSVTITVGCSCLPISIPVGVPIKLN